VPGIETSPEFLEKKINKEYAFFFEFEEHIDLFLEKLSVFSAHVAGQTLDFKAYEKKSRNLSPYNGPQPSSAPFTTHF
jgi:hypothetical protein